MCSSSLSTPVSICDVYEPFAVYDYFYTRIIPGKAAFIAQGPGTVQPVSLAGFAKISVLTNNLFHLRFWNNKRPMSAKNTLFTSSLYVITLNLIKAGLINPSSRPFLQSGKSVNAPYLSIIQ